MGLYLITIGIALYFAFFLMKNYILLKIYLTSLFLLFSIIFLGVFNLGPFKFLNNSSFNERIFFWRTAVSIFSDHPFFGSGIDSFGDFYLNYRTSIVSVEYVDNAHNFFVQYLATGGLLLFCTYLFVMLYICRRGIIAIKSSKNKSIIYGLFTIWTLLQFSSLVSIDTPGVYIWSWVIGGTIVKESFQIPIEVKGSDSKKFFPTNLFYYY